jgi:hypothetical protein
MFMRMRICLLVTTLGMAVSVCAQLEQPAKSIPTNAVILLEFEKTEFLVGENIFANYVISNRGGPVLKPNTGGDYRGGTRASRFKVTAVRVDGYVAPDPQPFQWMMGGLSPGAAVAAGSNWFEHVSVARYCEITEPGEYTITVFHDLGWGPRQSNDVREVSAKLQFKFPSDAEARAFVQQTLWSPAHNGWTWGKKGHQLPDVTVLYHPVYLPALLEHAEKGSLPAITGIASVRTVEGTEALVRLMQVPKPSPTSRPDLPVSATALQAAKYLEPRLPKPSPRASWENSEQATQRQRLQSTWHSGLAGPVRDFARGLLQASNREAFQMAASQMQVVGSANDFEALASALERATAMTDTEWRSDHGYPEPASVARALAATAFQLGRTNHEFHSPKTPGEALLFLQQLRQANSARPKDWERTSLHLLEDRSAFIRAQTIAALPRPAPKAIEAKLIALLLDEDVAVQNQAFHACEQVRSPVVRRSALAVLNTTADRWLFNTASSLAAAQGARAEAAEIIAKRLTDELQGPGADMRHEAMRALFRIASGGGHVSGGFNSRLAANEVAELQAGWIRFIAAHREEFQTGRKFTTNDGSGLERLLSRGWEFYPAKD